MESHEEFEPRESLEQSGRNPVENSAACNNGASGAGPSACILLSVKQENKQASKQARKQANKYGKGQTNQ